MNNTFSPSLTSCTVLLVDDDADVLREYGKVLERMGVRVVPAKEATSALELLRGQAIDVILTDLNMPGMGGLDFLRTVREINLDVPVLLMTGSPELETVMAAVDYGAFNYLTKPLDPVQLKVAVAQASQFHALARLQRLASRSHQLAGSEFADRATLESRFNRALAKLWIAYQPIVRFQQRAVFAFEGLVRSDEDSMKHPAAILEAADKLRRTQELGRRIREEIAHSAAFLPQNALLFVNVNPQDLDDEDMYRPTAPLMPYADRVVYEITERSAITSVSELAHRLRKLRDRGSRIAIDDLGAGYSSLSSFIHLEPDFVKLDMSLIRDVHRSSTKLSLIRGLHQICSGELNVQVISEGVEVAEEAHILAQEGLDLFQGYHFARPERGFPQPTFEAA
jgi:EAL domain-containing protein (putative c-di-GMP-specific phosphodiesterase class I)